MDAKQQWRQRNRDGALSDTAGSKDLEERGNESASPDKRPRVMPDVIASIASDILSGVYPPGSFLPRENDLGLHHGVSRTVIREALKVLAAKGLLTSRPRVGTLVSDPDDWNIIDPQVLSWHRPSNKLFDAILETRRGMEPLAAELAAKRATLREIADLEAAWHGMATAGQNTEQFAEHDIAFHRILYAASHNPVFHRIGGMIDAALRFSLHETTEHSPDMRSEAIAAHKDLVEALRMRDAAAARRATTHILDLAERDLKAAIGARPES